MSLLLDSKINHSTFFLTGFPGLEQQYPWLSIPFSCIYATVLSGNCLVLHVIWTEPSQHKIMFYFLAMLALTDLCMGLSTVHMVLAILWGLSQEIGLDACISQISFVHGLSGTESGVLLTVVCDRFPAICNPLRYTSILTNTRIIKIWLGILERSFIVIIPTIICLKFFYYYTTTHILSHSFCLHQDLLWLACSDIRFNSFYALALVICILLLVSVLILISFILILHSVLAIASQEEQLKSLQTCVSHICAVFSLYIPIMGLTMVLRFGKHLSPVVHVLHGQHLYLFPPLMNPIIYSVKSHQIRSRIQRWFTLKNN
ncbi:LOW QUALITY PROTEIN: olfactory receptor 51V1-like [Dasypus novemcinctus]|uniref:LOW QUALITY PROTEIN: olfactory receptor 51V1-like n=1 Tax=Dasypus novemcinctus TaxID=9361 RepID=UPI00265F8196|nr:LOW QUALITY PROTEIN: olfactory receptor 51V1-like [Dasypus novemcinctus]